ncbi:hypothetical protein Q8F55_006793 [Vanrija albida]|uniref:Uncharacterized protein n=1 Tax=Vanrija albida TaxID=181172 RepID=A0ABR3PYK1_9TREE
MSDTAASSAREPSSPATDEAGRAPSPPAQAEAGIAVAACLRAHPLATHYGITAHLPTPPPDDAALRVLDFASDVQRTQAATGEQRLAAARLSSRLVAADIHAEIVRELASSRAEAKEERRRAEEARKRAEEESKRAEEERVAARRFRDAYEARRLNALRVPNGEPWSPVLSLKAPGDPPVIVTSYRELETQSRQTLVALSVYYGLAEPQSEDAVSNLRLRAMVAQQLGVPMVDYPVPSETTSALPMPTTAATEGEPIAPVQTRSRRSRRPE